MIFTFLNIGNNDELFFLMKKIERKYLSEIALELCDFMPNANVEKSTLLKEREDDKNSRKQRKEIHGILE